MRLAPFNFDGAEVVRTGLEIALKTGRVGHKHSGPTVQFTANSARRNHLRPLDWRSVSARIPSYANCSGPWKFFKALVAPWFLLVHTLSLR